MEPVEQRRGLRITTWNVNGIRNPFGYQPWHRDQTFAAMFEILEADIVVMQETKIQRKDLRDDMVLVPGWDVFFSLPKHKKGYSGVAIYTRNSLCAPVRAEEGITGVLTPPNSTTSFRDLSKDQQIGGYPTASQLSDCSLDAATLDSEGRCVILEFPAFVLIGVYSPATRDHTRDEFRIGFLDALDARVRNLVALGKRVFLAGDLNIVREEMDTANAEEQLKKRGITGEEYVSTPARRMLNQLLLGGKIFGERDEGREKPLMWDICRLFHPSRQGMFTCWEQKINARPGNFGSRIDYVLCSYSWNDWFCESNIQEGLMGSDHCPVYAVLKDKVEIDGGEVDIRDIMSAGMFADGIRQREWSTKDLLLLSARLIPEFNNRRSIRDMFAKKSSLPGGESFEVSEGVVNGTISQQQGIESPPPQLQNMLPPGPATPLSTNLEPAERGMSSAKRQPESSSTVRPKKRSKSGVVSMSSSASAKGQGVKGQSSLMGFFKPKNPPPIEQSNGEAFSTVDDESDLLPAESPRTPSRAPLVAEPMSSNKESTPTEIQSPSKPFSPSQQKSVVDPIVAKESWSKILGRRVVPRCEHDEPCISMKTKKPGENCGRSFYMCPRPLGPSGQKEKKTQWRCGTFLWSSDWTKDGS